MCSTNPSSSSSAGAGTSSGGDFICPGDSQEAVLLTHHYQLCDVIEKSTFCTTYRAVQRATGQNFTVKSIDLKRCCATTGLTQDDIEREVEICARVKKHPHFVQLTDVIAGSSSIHMVFEWIDGQDIGFEIVKRAASGYIYSEAVASHYIKQLVDALQYLHSLNIVHRDIRPHNLLLGNRENNAPLKIRGLGLAYVITSDDSTTDGCLPGRIGVPNFMAPEIVAHRHYGKQVDMWSVGVLLYLMLSGRLPFVGSTLNELFEGILDGRFSLDAAIWRAISDPAKNLIQRLLTVDASKRITPSECLAHEWVATRSISPRTHLVDTIENLRRYNIQRRLKSNVVSLLNSTRWAKLSSTPNSASSASTTHSLNALPGGDLCDFEYQNLRDSLTIPDGPSALPETLEKVLTSLDKLAILAHPMAADGASSSSKNATTSTHDSITKRTIAGVLEDRCFHEMLWV